MIGFKVLIEEFKLFNCSDFVLLISFKTFCVFNCEDFDVNKLLFSDFDVNKLLFSDFVIKQFSVNVLEVLLIELFIFLASRSQLFSF